MPGQDEFDCVVANSKGLRIEHPNQANGQPSEDRFEVWRKFQGFKKVFTFVEHRHEYGRGYGGQNAQSDIKGNSQELTNSYWGTENTGLSLKNTWAMAAEVTELRATSPKLRPVCRRRITSMLNRTHVSGALKVPDIALAAPQATKRRISSAGSFNT